jgi:F-type H+-transporting ATPase subunit alpha
LSDDLGGGSLTALPIIETQEGDVAAYIPTNVISITDGQIYLESNLFNSGQRPAVDVGISVSRVGGNAQIKAMRSIASMLRLDLAQFRELEAFAKFGSDLDQATLDQLTKGRAMMEIIRQNQFVPMPIEKQVAIIFVGIEGLLNELPLEKVKDFETGFLGYLDDNMADLLKDIRDKGELDDSIKENLTKAAKDYLKIFAG